MPSTWRHWATVPICSPAPTMWANTRAIPWSMKSPRNIWRTKPFPPCSPKRRSTSAIRMSGEAPARPLPLTAPAISHGCSINVAGMWGGWAHRAYTTTAPPPARPSRAIWCFCPHLRHAGGQPLWAVCGGWLDAPLRRSHQLHQPQQQLLAISFLRLRAFTMT